MKAEQLHQQGVAHYLRVAYPEVRFTIAPANTMNVYHGRVNKCMGYSAGTPDIMIFARRGGFGALFIELKAPAIRGYENGKERIIKRAGRLADEQIGWLKDLNNAGYKAVTCYGSQEAYKVIDEYLKGER